MYQQKQKNLHISLRCLLIKSIVVIASGFFFLVQQTFACNQPLGLGIKLCFVDLSVQSLRNNFADVSFMFEKNHFGGSIFWLPTKALSQPITLTLGGQSRVCSRQIRGIYYNNQRGQRLFPLDQDTLANFRSFNSSYNDLTLIGGWYTSCSGYQYDIYGQIRYTWGGVTSSLSAGFIYGMNNEFLSSTSFNRSLQYFDNKSPVGYFFDTNGGIGFIGGELNQDAHDAFLAYLNNGGTVNSGIQYTNTGSDLGAVQVVVDGNTFTLSGATPLNVAARDTIWNIGLQGSASLSRALDDQQRASILGNPTQGSNVYNAPDITNATVMNQAIRSASSACRGQRVYTSLEEISSVSSPATSPSLPSVLCVQRSSYNPSDRYMINLSQDSLWKNTTFVFKNIDVVLQGTMTGNNSYINLLIENGNLLFENNPLHKLAFDKNGYVTGGVGVTSGVYLKGNFFVNGLIGGFQDGQMTGYRHKLYLHGKLVALNTPGSPGQGRLTQINNLFGPRYDDFINLQNAFVGRCDPSSALFTDGSPCGHDDDRYAQMPLVIINTNWKNIFIQ